MAIKARASVQSSAARKVTEDWVGECFRGHPMTPETTYVNWRTGFTTCKTCRNELARAKRLEARKAKGLPPQAKRGEKPSKKNVRYCKNGHAKIGDNAIVNSRGYIDCRKCRSATNKRYKDAQRKARESGRHDGERERLSQHEDGGRLAVDASVGRGEDPGPQAQRGAGQVQGRRQDQPR